MSDNKEKLSGIVFENLDFETLTREEAIVLLRKILQSPTEKKEAEQGAKVRRLNVIDINQGVDRQRRNGRTGRNEEVKEVQVEEVVETVEREEPAEVVQEEVAQEEVAQEEVVQEEVAQEVAQADELEFLEEFEGRYTAEEANGEFEKFTDEEIEAVAEMMNPDQEGVGAQTEEEFLQGEVKREMTLQEKKKMLANIREDRKIVNKKIFDKFFNDFKSLGANTIIGVQTVGQTIGNTVKRYGRDYAKKKSIEKEYNDIRSALVEEWNSVYDDMLKEITELENEEDTQIARISGYENAKEKIKQQRQEKERAEISKLVYDYRTDNLEGLEEAKRNIKKYLRTIEKYDVKINEEEEILEGIRKEIDEGWERIAKKRTEYNLRLGKLDVSRSDELATVPKQNMFQKAIGKIVSMFTSKKSNSGEKKQEDLDKIKDELERAQQESEEYREEREERAERALEADGQDEIESLYFEKSFKDRFEENKRLSAEKKEENKKLAVEKKKEKARLKQEKENAKMDQRIAKAQARLKELQGKLNIAPVIETEGR